MQNTARRTKITVSADGTGLVSQAVAAWLAALIVGAVLLVAAGAAALLGKSRLQKATPPVPTETVGSVKTDVEVIKERAQR